MAPVWGIRQIVRLGPQLQKLFTEAKQRRAGLMAVMRKNGYLKDPKFRGWVQAKVSELSRTLTRVSAGVFIQMSTGQQRSVLVLGELKSRLKNLPKQ